MSRTLINQKTIKRIEEEKKDKTKFLTITYDVPSENISGLTDSKKRDLFNRRINLINYIRTNCIFLNKSVYIVNVERVSELITKFEEIYSDLPKEFNVDLKIIGNAYDFIVKDVLRNNIDDLEDKIKKKLEIVETKIGKEDTEELRKKVYNISRKLEILDSRIADLELINRSLANIYKEKYNKLREFREKLLRELRY